MNAVFYSLAQGGSELAAAQLLRSVQSLRLFDTETTIYVFLFGQTPVGFAEALQRLDAVVRHLGDYSEYVIRRQPRRGAMFARDPKIHRWLVLEEPELLRCGRLLYVDSDTIFFGSPTILFDRYRQADFYAREEPYCRRSNLGYRPNYIDEQQIDALRNHFALAPVAPFNTGVCLLTSDAAIAVTSVLADYFDNLFRFLCWFHTYPGPDAPENNSSIRALLDPAFQPAPERAMPYPSTNRWIVDQVAMWLALGQCREIRFADFATGDVWQGAEFERMSTSTVLPILCHYFSSNTERFFDWLQKLPADALRQGL